MTCVRHIWQFVLRASGLCLSVFAVVFMSVPAASTWKKLAGIACAIFGSICLIAMYFAKKPGSQEEIHLVKRELEHYPPGASNHDSPDVGDHD